MALAMGAGSALRALKTDGAWANAMPKRSSLGSRCYVPELRPSDPLRPAARRQCKDLAHNVPQNRSCGGYHIRLAGRMRGCQVRAETAPSQVEDSAPPKQDLKSAMSGNGVLVQQALAPGTVENLVTPFDYGFQAQYLRTGPAVPGNVITLAIENFWKEWKALRRNVRFIRLQDPKNDNINRNSTQLAAAYVGRATLELARQLDRLLTRSPIGLYSPLTIESQPISEEVDELRAKLGQLTLDNDKVWDRERGRPPVKAPWYILGPYYFLCLMLDVIFEGRPIQRFWFLETVARMPYFSYISMLHLYETLGWWRIGAEVRKVHFAEEWNEMHHLKIMESLGGDNLWIDRFFGQHAAIVYYWVLNTLFLVSPSVAYNFSELIEYHAVDTYGEFVDANEELLKSLPPSPVAVAYYTGDDLYMFDEFQTSRAPASRRPKVENLYDVFCNIRDDEFEHVKTMVACQNVGGPVESPNRVAASKPKSLP